MSTTGERRQTHGDETREGGDTPENPSETCVVITAGSERRVIEVRDHLEVVVGRSSGCTFVVDDDRVSRKHLSIVFRDGALYATDLGSRNGTQLNGRKLVGERIIASGDELVAGPVRVQVVGGRPRLVASEDELHRALLAEVERALRFRRVLGVVGLRFDGAPSSNAAAAQKVASRLGRVDRIGEYATGEYLVLLPERSLDRARAEGETFAAVAREVAGVQATARAAAVPETASAPDAIVAAVFAAASALSGAGEDEDGEVIAEDDTTREVFELARRAARSHVTVLVTGESGVGKELVAAEIHHASSRAGGPYVRINCAALPETLLESELFGHERGAFTGADRRRVGIVESASSGTLLLDEIGEMPLSMQAKLLRVIEGNHIARLGGAGEIAIDVRFVAATNRDLEREVVQGTFREDLYFRLSAITLRVPPLRERPRDLLRLAQRFTRSSAATVGRAAPRLAPDFVAGLQRYPWPGNVRELKNVIDRAVILADVDELTVEQLPVRFAAYSRRSGEMGIEVAPVGAMRRQLDDLERRNLVEALRATAGNRTHAAKKLGISRRALLYKLKKFDLQ